MDDICSKNYAHFLEETLRDMLQLPVEGICIITKLRGGAVFTNYFQSSMTDKITYAGIIQQDAMLEMLQANNMNAQGNFSSPEE